MPETFKTRRNQDPVRLASTSGHVAIVGKEWVEVPDSLVPDALKNGLLSKELYDAAMAEARQEAVLDITHETPVAVVKEEILAKDLQEEETRETKILKAVQTVMQMALTGREETEGGMKLLSQTTKQPMVNAVSEIAGFRVMANEIDEAMA